MPLTLSIPEETRRRPASGSWPRWLYLLLGIISVFAICMGFMRYEDYASAEYSAPWDAIPLDEHSVPYSCEPVPLLSTSIRSASLTSLSALPNGSDAGSAPSIKAILVRVEAAADAYQATGSRAAADCVIRTLGKEASADALDARTDNPGDQELRRLSVGALAITLLKVRHSSSFSDDPTVVRKIAAWMKMQIYPTVLQYGDGEDRLDAHTASNQVWTALDLLAVSIVSSDSDLFARGDNLLNRTLWELAPRIDGKPLEGGKQLECSRVLPALAPAALAFELEAAHGFNSASVGLDRLHEVSIRCIDHQNVRSQNASTTRSEHQQHGRPVAQISWLSSYVPFLASTDTSLLLGSYPDIQVLLGGNLPQ